MKNKTVKTKQTADEMRLTALELLRKAKALEQEEKKQKFYNIGTLINRYVDGEISGKEMKAELKKITGKEMPSEQKNNIIGITENEVNEAIK